MLDKEYLEISTEDLLKFGYISVRTRNVCRNAELYNLGDIIKYYSEGNSFIIIRNSGNQTTKELIQLCTSGIHKIKVDIRFPDQLITQEVRDNKIQLKFSSNYDELKIRKVEYLRDYKAITVRSYTTCKTAELNTIEDILNYYLQGKKFSEIRNSGRLTNEELTSFCKQILSDNNIVVDIQVPVSDDEMHFIDLQNKLSSLDLVQKEYLQLYYNELIHSFDYRLKHALSDQCPTVNDYFATISFSKASPIRYLRNVGKNHESLLIQFQQQIEEKIDEIISNSSSDNSIKWFTLKYNLPSEILDTINIFFTKHNYFPMFFIIGKTIEYELLKNDRNTYILVYSFHVLDNKILKSREEISKETSISIERVRQLRVLVVQSFFSNNNNLLSILDSWEHYKYLKEEPFISLNCSIINIIKTEEDSNLSKIFILRLISYVFYSEFKIFGDIETIPFEPPLSDWTSVYLINRELTKIFDFELFRSEFCNYISQFHYEDFTFDFSDFLKSSLCWNIFDFERFDLIEKITLEIIWEEFGLYCDLDQRITIKAKLKEHPSEVIFNIIKNNGSPMYIESIFQEFKKIIPEKYESADKIRYLIARNKEITFINRSSLYSLKEWSHIKTGTIRDAIEDILNLESIPIPISIIVERILTYFPLSNNSSIQSSIRLDKKRFILFENNLIGLTYKKYPDEFKIANTISKVKPQFDDRLSEIENFIISNGHFPFNSKDKHERSLYLWWKTTILKIMILSSAQQAKVQFIQEKYANYNIDKQTYQWYVQYSELYRFIQLNRRWPHNYNKEETMYNWMIKNFIQIRKDKLNEDQRKKIIALSKLL